ncbi:AFR206Cp [Eremothecium gossypii ATCC 10895]|uniref:AFR206Cp n=1 Tax=Eremothecium gossypii (strain ATCC 10895 / CBS 109.51 / FGSC 9923 / NRRL Y-1056) TaxID=284811 RepID=Q753W6_EREGS|nr:AFR206Cp [Eremothecium gossypii ATCC 10895]AAS53577.1 AFR206Cp [Eremothecium gossypii ATCC 10895]AEY97890.1 FAFR206Cp [Eremothecium gossypii FDAG1]
MQKQTEAAETRSRPQGARQLLGYAVGLTALAEVLLWQLFRLILAVFWKREPKHGRPDAGRVLEAELAAARDIYDMCRLFGVSLRTHMVRTEDDYLLAVHHIPASEAGAPVVYLHHGLMMSSDIWCCRLDRQDSLPFVLAASGYDVWMGNNRGNRYSTKHLRCAPHDERFWDFSLDEFALFDIPNTVDYILAATGARTLTCIGFSQGSAQLFAALSVHAGLNCKVSRLVAIAPAMTPPGMHHRLLDSLIKFTPNLTYLLFGRKALLSSTVLWQRLLPHGVFDALIDRALCLLFGWRSANIAPEQKHVSYSKLYSTTSVKCIVHWFQILRAQQFQFFHPSDCLFHSVARPYAVAHFPTNTSITVPTMLIYGTSDSLVGINVLLKNLPGQRLDIVAVPGYEHLDLLWGRKVRELVIKPLLALLDHDSRTRAEDKASSCQTAGHQV